MSLKGMGAALQRDHHPSLRLQRAFVTPPPLSHRFPHHLPHQEKSATKEAISILQLYLGPESTAADATLPTASATADVSQENGNSVRLSLVKLTSSGLLLFIFPNDRPVQTADIAFSIFQSLGSGSLKSPRWCRRVFPIQATCRFNEKELHAVVTKLIRQFVNDEKKEHAGPFKYAVGFNRRGLREKEFEPSKYSTEIDAGAHLDRSKCFEIVGSAVEDVIPDSTVDLNNPEMSILLEFLPLSGVPNGSPVVAIAVLAPNFVVTKPKLCVQALLSACKMTDKAL